MNLKLLLTTGLIASAFASGAQNANKGYAITGNNNKDYMWMNIRQIDLGTGQVTKNIFDYATTKYTMDVAGEGQKYVTPAGTAASFVAAAALDKRNDKLFYVPMRIGQLRWIDVSAKGETVVIHGVEIPGYKASDPSNEDQNITRMVIGADNNGYAINNDGSHLYQFTTGKKPVITDLGALVDAEENKGMSVHNRCSSWGGDMIADAYGKLYIISANRNVFVVDPSTRVTTFKGTISGLPATYTTNGAAVNEKGEVLICSAVTPDSYYKLNINDLKAEKLEGSDATYSTSDLASGNLLFQKEADDARKFALTKSLPLTTAAGESMIYPNPVTSGSFRVLLDGKQDGAYTIVITDLAGRALQSNKVGLVKGQQSQEVTLKSHPAKGTYLVKVMDEKNNVVLSDKVLIL